MPNGHDTVYNQDWCKERHVKLDKRMDALENKFWGIILLLIANLATVSTILIKGVT